MLSCQFYPTHVLAFVLLGCFAWLHMTATAAAESGDRFAKGAKKRPHVDEDEE